MSMLYSWLRLLRPLNIVMIAFTPVLLWIVLVRPQLGIPVLSLQQVWRLGLAVALVAAGGNIVNDIADRTIDELNNRPNPLLSGLPLWAAWLSYAVCTLGALVITYILADQLHMWRAAFLLPLSLGLLLAYAFALKCVPWIGNLVVSLFCAGVPALIILAEPVMREDIGARPLAQSLLAYVIIAFFGTWAREVVKDLEDREGDDAAGCRPLAVRWPIARTLRLAGACLFVTMAAVAYVSVVWYRTGLLFNAFAWGALYALLGSIMFSLSAKHSKADFARTSQQLKVAMGFGLALLLLLGFTL